MMHPTFLAPLLALVPAYLPAPAPAALSPLLRASRGAPCMTEAAVEAPSFVQTEMRRAAMALHTKDQAPREGQQPAQKPVSAWQPGRAEYLQFLVDSLAVYQCLEQIVESTPALASFGGSGLERSEALAGDIAWFAEEGLEAPALAAPGKAYVELLEKMAADSEYERFVCHFYNHYFAHTAGGRMIGKR